MAALGVADGFGQIDDPTGPVCRAVPDPGLHPGSMSGVQRQCETELIDQHFSTEAVVLPVFNNPTAQG